MGLRFSARRAASLMLACVVLVIAFLHAARASAEPPSVLTVAALERDCRTARQLDPGADLSAADGMRAVRCLAYLSGLADMLNLGCLLLRQGAVAGSLPAAATAVVRPRDLIVSFLDWAARHPEESDGHQSLAGLAFVAAFPCR